MALIVWLIEVDFMSISITINILRIKNVKPRRIMSTEPHHQHLSTRIICELLHAHKVIYNLYVCLHELWPYK